MLVLTELAPPGTEKRQETFLEPGAGFSKGPVALRGPKANSKINTCWIVAQFLAHKPVSVALLTDSFLVSFPKLLILNANAANLKSFSGPKCYRDFWESGPWTVI